MQKNEYLLARIGVDTAENEPSKVSRKWAAEWECKRAGQACNTLRLGKTDVAVAAVVGGWLGTIPF